MSMETFKYELYYDPYSSYPWHIVKVESRDGCESRSIVEQESTMERALKYIRSWEQVKNNFGVKIL